MFPLFLERMLYIPLTITSILQEFIDSGVVGGGMLPKLTNCIEAMKNGVARVHMLDGRVEHCLLLEFFTEKGIGTAILKEPLF